jgi:uncharacterized protein (UPF0332 family)
VHDEVLQTSVHIRMQKARECLRDAEMNIANNAYASAANRSYYCIFHAIRAVLITINYSAKTHSGNIGRFQRDFIKTGLFEKKYSSVIENSFTVRNKSDYQDFYIVSKDEVSAQVKNAQTFLEAVEAYLQTLC